MAISKDKKIEIVKSIRDAIDSSESMTFVTFQGISGNEITNFRSDLRGKNVSYIVAKKTLTKRAFEDSPVSGDIPSLPGELGLAYSADPIASAREVYAFEKKNPKNLQITGGVFEGRYMNRDEMLSIATIPDTDVLRGMFVNIINSPIQGLVLALNAFAEKQEQNA